MRVSILGLGYVGTVTGACLADRGFSVTGVDVNSEKVEMINNGQSPIVEEAIGEIVERTTANGNLIASSEVPRAVHESDVSLVCVGTPSKANGDLDLTYVSRVAEQIGSALAEKSSFHTVVVRSTVLPGTTEAVLKPLLEQRSGKRAGQDFGLCFNPEFLREGSSVQDFHSPPFTLVGAMGDRDVEAVRALFGWLDAEFLVEGIATAEMVKYINNSYHALKVAFANEVGRLCAVLGIDSHAVMDIFCKDTKQNLSSYYLKPGFAFGGSCLPKDLRAILYKAKTLDVPMEVFQATLRSNRTQIESGVQLVERTGNRSIGLLGLSFKAGTDDLRESPLVTLVETLTGRGYKVRIYDRSVSLSRLIGANKTYIEEQLPHIGLLLCDSLEEVLETSDTIVIGNADPHYREAIGTLNTDKPVVDLVRVSKELPKHLSGYEGIGW